MTTVRLSLREQTSRRQKFGSWRKGDGQNEEGGEVYGAVSRGLISEVYGAVSRG